MRNGTDDVAQSEEAAAARDAWLRALRNRGIEPFLREVRRTLNREQGQNLESRSSAGAAEPFGRAFST
ncbi:hypothetical protein ACGFWD_39020 [Streptomyces sp. NPDC048448]|uniref:hypothetical protein n=1 Tax=Streptomyces sp. NPDC048448 TaxID=3365554 RepID=UPI0037150114